MESRAEAKRLRSWQIRGANDPWSDELAIADHLANQPVTPETAVRYSQFLLRLTSLRSDPPSDIQSEQYIQHLTQGSRVAPAPADRATLALAAASFAKENLRSSERIDRLFTDALTAAQGTASEPVARAHDFLRRAETGRLTPDKNRHPDIPVWLRELDSILASLDPAVTTESSKTARKQLLELKTRWTEQRFELEFPAIFRPEEPVRFTIGCAYINKLTYEIHRVAPRNWPWFSESASSKDKKSPPSFTPDQILTWSADLSSAAPHHWRSRIETAPAPLVPGLYVLVIRDETGVRQLRHFAVSAVEATALCTHNATWEFFCYDNKTHAPQSAKSVQLWTFATRDDLTQNAVTTSTDADGRLVTDFTASTNSNVRALLLIEGTHPVIFDQLNNNYSRSQRTSDLHIDTFLPRELYRPGETVHWKLIARERQNGRFIKPADGRNLTMKVLSNDTPLCEPHKITWDESGAASGELVIPAYTRPGDASLEFFDGEKRVANISFFTVDSFLPPPALATLDLAGDSTALRPDSTATFRFNARYFSGGPVVGAPVEFRIAVLNPYIQENNTAQASREAWQKDLAARTFTAVTDAEGNATCSVTLPDFLLNLFSAHVGYTVKPAGLQEISGSKELKGSASGLWLDLDEKSVPRVVRPGEPVTIRFRYLDPLEHPARVTGEVSLLETQWEEVWLDPKGQPVNGNALAAARRERDLAPSANLPAGWKKIHAETATTLIETNDPVVHSDGWAAVTFTPPHAGSFHLQFNAANGTVTAKGELWDFPRTASKRAAPFYAVDDATLTLPLPPSDSVVMPVREITTGEKPRFFVVLPEGTQRAFLALTGETETRTQPITTSGRAAFVTFENPPAFSSVGTVRLILPEYTYDYSESWKQFTVLHPETIITTEIAPTSAEVRPGASGEAIIRTRGSDQRPLSANVALAISDQAVNQLLSTDPEIVSDVSRLLRREKCRDHEQPSLNKARARRPLFRSVLRL
ncbi:MAG: MG2 domain-containing protein [Nibricoccus sp.]